MADADAITRLLTFEIKRRGGELFLSEARDSIAFYFGRDGQRFVTRTEKGGYSIDKAARDKFRAMNPGVRYGRGMVAWDPKWYLPTRR